MRRLVLAAAAVLLLAGCAGLSTGTQPADGGTLTQTTPAGDGGGSTPDPTKPAAPSYTKAQEQAIGAAQDYLSYQAFSKQGLIDQLSSKYGDGFKKKDAEFAVEHIEVDWNKQAVKAAKSYLELSHFSRNGLIEQLSSSYGDQFTHAQAVYAANKVGL